MATKKKEPSESETLETMPAPEAHAPAYEDIVEQCAKAAHEANRVYCASIGDASQVPWESAAEWQRESARLGVLKVLQENVSPEQSHASWFTHKLEQGWRYGEKKDEALKLHPCMVDFRDLPAEQRAKDALFGVVVRGVAASLGMKLPSAAFMV